MTLKLFFFNSIIHCWIGELWRCPAYFISTVLVSQNCNCIGYIPRNSTLTLNYIYRLTSHRTVNTLHFSQNKTGDARINVTLGRICIIIVVVGKQWVLCILCVCVCSFSYPVRIAHAPDYVVACGASGCTMFFPHYLINGTILGGKYYWTINSVLIFSTTFFYNVSHSGNNSARYFHKSTYYPLFLSYFNQTVIFSTHFRENLKYQISWNCVQRHPNCSVRTDEQRDRYDETNSRFWQFCERA
jgi:hypothetical protein